MSGRIKFVDEDGVPLNSDDTPAIEYEYDTVADFDKMCGTFNTSIFQLPHDQCPDKFVCDVASDTTSVSRAEDDEEILSAENYALCIDAMNCAMMVGMSTDAKYGPLALFIHQMIPHHQNAVNMAKATLKAGVTCEDLTDEEDPNCIMERILLDIIHGQNAQIQAMRGVLDQLEFPRFADCEVPVFGLEATLVTGEPQKASSSPVKALCWFVAILGMIGSLWA
jgi:Domain of unknown function (DUF305)